jgi:hypothetical protein
MTSEFVFNEMVKMGYYNYPFSPALYIFLSLIYSYILIKIKGIILGSTLIYMKGSSWDLSQ